MIVSQTALRISFLGGNTDFPEYYNQYIYCIVSKRFDNEIWINYSNKEMVTNVDDIKHDLVRECLKLVEITGGIEITFLSDIPSSGSGLGSSSAVAVGLLNALYQFNGQQVTNAILASLAVKVEIDILQKPIGVQDQIIAAYGGLRHIRLGKVVNEVLNIDASKSFINDFDNSLMLFYTNKTRKADNVLKDMKLDKTILDKNKKLADQAVVDLKLGKIREIGKALDDYWELKKKLNPKVSDEEINIMYKSAKKAGAIGGKIIGAGGGGFLLLMAEEGKKEAIRKALEGYRELEFKFSNTGSRIIFNNE
jgi:D-glycero-alpha-D-manno-heptose-7-phosphate kinase